MTQPTFTISKSSVRRIYPGDIKWHIKDGFTISPRAGLEIKKECPDSYKKIIQTCVMNGWLVPLAHVRDAELFWESFHE